MLTGKILRQSTGHILGFEFDQLKQSGGMAQMVELGVEFLTHAGVKGMKWGVRNDSRSGSTPRLGFKSPPTPVSVKATSKVPHGSKRKTQIKVKGGENHDAADDAIKVAQAKAKFRKSGPAALSNKELQDLQTRLNLERNVKQLVTSQTQIGKGRNFVKGLTGLNKEVNETVGTGINTARLRKQVVG